MEHQEIPTTDRAAVEAFLGALLASPETGSTRVSGHEKLTAGGQESDG